NKVIPEPKPPPDPMAGKFDRSGGLSGQVFDPVKGWSYFGGAGPAGASSGPVGSFMPPTPIRSPSLRPWEDVPRPGPALGPPSMYDPFVPRAHGGSTAGGSNRSSRPTQTSSSARGGSQGRSMFGSLSLRRR